MFQRFRSLTLLTAGLVVASQIIAVNAEEGSDTKAGSGTKQGSATHEGSAAKAGLGTKEGFVSLFNGENLDNWVRHGGQAEYTIEGNSIVGTAMTKLSSPNTFLCTKRDYADFILEFEVKVHDGLNSGVQIRSHIHEQSGQVEIQKGQGGGSYVVKYDKGRVHGYQVEIDPTERAFSGGIYDEARRGWLQNPSGDEKKSVREAFKLGEWNKFRVEAVGTSFKTWINGVAVTDLTDDMTASGFIGLQVHGIGNDESLGGKQVRWRNIWLKEVTQP